MPTAAAHRHRGRLRLDPDAGSRPRVRLLRERRRAHAGAAVAAGGAPRDGGRVRDRDGHDRAHGHGGARDRVQPAPGADRTCTSMMSRRPAPSSRAGASRFSARRSTAASACRRSFGIRTGTCWICITGMRRGGEDGWPHGARHSSCCRRARRSGRPTRGKAIDLATLSFPSLTPLREALLDDELRTAPTTTAGRLYTGVLYAALDIATLPRGAARNIVIVSAQFGALRAGRSGAARTGERWTRRTGARR